MIPPVRGHHSAAPEPSGLRAPSPDPAAVAPIRVFKLPRLSRRDLKQSVERALVLTGSTVLARRWSASATLVLAYHNIVPDGERGGADRSLHLPQRHFAAQLELLARTHEVVALGEVLEGAPRRTARPRAVITFDDGSAGALSVGVTELRRFGFPATFFVTPGRLGRHAFWWDRLGTPGDGEVPASIRSHALTSLRGEDEAVCAWAGARAAPTATVPENARTATEAELTAALAIPGLSVAAHTWSHPNLTTLDAATLQAELERPLAWLRARWATALPVVSYPFGLTSPAVTEAARRAGYRAGFLVTGGWLRGRRDAAPFDLPRVNVPAGVSPAGFELFTSGLVRR
jgi:peptidoglycan/xylan/chitin deacetylase (PgdA/CDA1 family)